MDFERDGHARNPTFCLKLLIEKKRRELETHLLFVDYEKVFDNIQRQILFDILKSIHIPGTLLKAIVDIYTQNKILIKFNNKLSKPVEINKGICQGCRLSPTLFNIYLDEIITKWQKQDITGIKLKKTATVNAVICRRPSYRTVPLAISDFSDSLHFGVPLFDMRCVKTIYDTKIVRRVIHAVTTVRKVNVYCR